MADLSAPILVLFFINQPLSLEKPTNNLGFSYRVSVVRAPNRESKCAKLITTYPSGGDGARMNTKAGTQGTLEILG